MTGRFLFLLFLASAAPASAEVPGVRLKDAVPHLAVTGNAKADVVPDQADLQLAVRLERKTADSASEATAKAATAVIADIKARGIEPADIRTSFELSQTFDAKTDGKGHVIGRMPRGFQGEETITIRVRDVAKVGPLARALIVDGANSIEDVTFSYAGAEKKNRELDAEAMRDAFLRAKTYAGAIGLNLGRVLQVGTDPAGSSDDEDNDLPSRRAPPVYVPPASEPEVSTAIPTEPGVLHLRRTVTVIWEIEQAK